MHRHPAPDRPTPSADPRQEGCSSIHTPRRRALRPRTFAHTPTCVPVALCSFCVAGVPQGTLSPASPRIRSAFSSDLVPPPAPARPLLSHFPPPENAVACPVLSLPFSLPRSLLAQPPAAIFLAHRCCHFCARFYKPPLPARPSSQHPPCPLLLPPAPAAFPLLC